MPVLPSLLLVPAAPTALSDIVHSSITASPGSEAMVDPPSHSASLPLAFLPLSPPLRLLSAAPPCPRVEERARSRVFSVCLRVRVCVWLRAHWSWELEPSSSASFGLPAASRACTLTYTDFRQAAGGRGGCERGEG